MRPRLITHRQGQVLDLVEGLLASGYPPTVRELSKRVGCGVALVHGMLTDLRDRGRIDWELGRRRTLRLVEPLTADERSMLGLPGSEFIGGRRCRCAAVSFGVPVCPVCRVPFGSDVGVDGAEAEISPSDSRCAGPPQPR